MSEMYSSVSLPIGVAHACSTCSPSSSCALQYALPGRPVFQESGLGHICRLEIGETLLYGHNLAHHNSSPYPALSCRAGRSHNRIYIEITPQSQVPVLSHPYQHLLPAAIAVAPIKGAFSSWGVPTTRCFVTQRFCRYPNQHLLFETSQTNLDIPYVSNSGALCSAE